ncbi:flagellar assembly protein FliH [Euryhalocaulis caribicus]|uniref:flagellar assembly protein FliH n=1 Tax=Euryhalocaulis caribicus TaxID=1161401 RepID=UPI0003A763EB|nr:flagellar assembly protein FliH [Euryhalocaulis caribicus]
MKNAKPFQFGTEFSADGEVLRSAETKRVLTLEEVEAEKDKAREEGRQGMEAEAAQALKTLAGQMQMALSQTASIHDSLRADAAELALTAARKIAGAALDGYPDAELTDLIESCASELRAAPRLRARVPAHLMDRLKPALEQAVAEIGFEGMLRVDPVEDAASGMVCLDWDEGAVTFDPEETTARIETLVRGRMGRAPAGGGDDEEQAA